MRRKIIVLGIGLLVLLVAWTGSSMAGGDQNTNTNGEDGNYEENNNNPYDDEDFPGQDDQQRNGVIW
jgi:hypothetical protein